VHTLCLLAVSTGCARFRQLKVENARLDALSKFAGKVDAKDWSGDPLIVVVMIKPAQTGVPVVITGRIVLDQPGPFSGVVEPDVYMLGRIRGSQQKLEV
jgi:hypothetical protein